MKYVTVLFDGMADHPDKDGQTPMSLAHKPMCDKLAKTAQVGLVGTVPADLKPGSDVANLSVMGYDPRICYTGRSPLEAISMGITLETDSVTYRCNLVTLSADEPYEDKTMLDYSAGDITTEEAAELIEFLDKELSTNELKFYAGMAYRHCLKRNHGTVGAILTPPHDISDRKITNWLPSGKYGEQLYALMKKSYELLKDHPVNVNRIQRGLKPANSIWLWGEGTKPKLDVFTSLYHLRGAVISAVDLIKGIAIGAGLTSIDVEGVTANINTNYDGKAQAAIEALDTYDYVYVHMEAPDECGHQGDKAGKTRAIELIDEKIVTPIYNALLSRGESFKILILPDHATPWALKTHTSEPVPYLLYSSDTKHNGVTAFTEHTAMQTGNKVKYGFQLLNKMLQH